MPYALIIIALLLLSAAYNGTTQQLQALVVKDFTGTNNFIYWLGALSIVGAIGFYSPLEKISRGFLLLIIVVMVVENGGVFQQLTSAIQNFQAPAATPDPLASLSAPQNASAVAGAVAGALGGSSTAGSATVNALTNAYNNPSLSTLGTAAGSLAINPFGLMGVPSGAQLLGGQ